MSSHHFSPAVWRPLAFAAVLLSCVSHSASGQVPSFTRPQFPDTTPNPPTYGKRFAGRRTDNRTKTAPGKPTPTPTRVSAAEERQEKIEQAITDGNGARDRYEYNQALTHYREVSKLDPKEPRAFYGMGNVYSDLYCYDSAVAAYRTALDLKNDYVEALVGLGYAYVGKESYDEALEKFQEAHRKRNNVDTNLALGVVYALKNDYTKATEQINLIINDKLVSDKDRAKAHNALGDVYWMRGFATNWEWPEIIAQYEKAINADPGLARAYVGLGSAKMTLAFEKFVSVPTRDATVQDRERLVTASKEATGYIEKAINEHGYRKPDADLILALGLTRQARYQDAINKVNAYLDKINSLKLQMSSPEIDMAVKCGFGFGRSLASGYWYLGFVRVEESTFEADARRKAALLDEARGHFEDAVKLKEDYALAYSELGLVYYRQGKYNEAVEQCNNALIHTKAESGKKQLHNTIKAAYIRKAWDESNREKYEDAIEDFTKALLHAPEEPDKASIYEDIGLAYLSLRRFDDAIRSVQEAVRRDPKNPSRYETLASIYVNQGDIENTFKLLKKADEVRTTPSTNPDPYYYLGATYAIRFSQNGTEADFNEAVTWLKKAVEIKRDYTAAYYGLGMVYQAHSNPNEALDSYEKAVLYDPKNPTAQMKFGQGYFELKHNDEAAIQYFKRAIELKPDYAEAHWRLGMAHHHNKDDAEAVKELLEAIRYAPNDLQGYLALASVYKDQKKYAEAVQYLNKAAGVAPKDFRPQKELAKLYEEQKRNDDAIRSYEEAISLIDANSSMYAWYPWTKNLYLGRIERLRGRYAEAIAYFQKLPQPPAELPGQTIYEIGFTYVAGRNKRAALEQYQQLVRMKSPLADELRNKIDEMK